MVRIRPVTQRDLSGVVFLPFDSSKVDGFFEMHGRPCPRLRGRNPRTFSPDGSPATKRNRSADHDTFEDTLRRPPSSCAGAGTIPAEGAWTVVSGGYAVGAWGRVLARGSYHGDYFALARIELEAKSPHCHANGRALALAKITGIYTRGRTFGGRDSGRAAGGCGAGDAIEVRLAAARASRTRAHRSRCLRCSRGGRGAESDVGVRRRRRYLKGIGSSPFLAGRRLRRPRRPASGASFTPRTTSRCPGEGRMPRPAMTCNADHHRQPFLQWYCRLRLELDPRQREVVPVVRAGARARSQAPTAYPPLTTVQALRPESFPRQRSSRVPGARCPRRYRGRRPVPLRGRTAIRRKVVDFAAKRGQGRPCISKNPSTFDESKGRKTTPLRSRWVTGRIRTIRGPAQPMASSSKNPGHNTNFLVRPKWGSGRKLVLCPGFYGAQMLFAPREE